MRAHEKREKKRKENHKKIKERIKNHIFFLKKKKQFFKNSSTNLNECFGAEREKCSSVCYCLCLFEYTGTFILVDSH